MNPAGWFLLWLQGHLPYGICTAFDDWLGKQMLLRMLSKGVHKCGFKRGFLSKLRLSPLTSKFRIQLN